jgi:hypothetical protein
MSSQIVRSLVAAASLAAMLSFAAIATAQEQPEPRTVPRDGGSRRQARTVPEVTAEDLKAGPQITLEFVIVEAPADAESDAKTPAQILELAKAGGLSELQRLKLTALDNQRAQVQFGEQASLPSGRSSFGPIRGETTTYSTHSLGTIAHFQARVEEEGAIVANWMLERSRVPAQQVSDAAATDAPPAIRPPQIEQLSAQGTVRLKPGVPTLVVSRQTVSSAGKQQTWVLLIATVTPKE